MKNHSEFLDHIMTRFYVAIHERPQNNFDALRFNFNGVDRSGEFALQKHKNYFYFLFNNFPALFQSFNLFEDNYSKKLFIDLILFKLAGHLHVKLATNNSEHWRLRKEAERLAPLPSEIKYTGNFGPLLHFNNIVFNNQKINVDCWLGSVMWTYYLKQYYYGRNRIRIQPEKGDHVIDGGSCFGDTALAFASTVGSGGKVYSFEALDKHVDIINYNVNQNPDFKDIIRVFPYGLGDTCVFTTGQTTSDTNLSPGFSLNNPEFAGQIPIRNIDYLVDNNEIERVDFIKMDIEGFELKALRGAEQTIRRFRPRLAISLYHKNEDMFEIPIYLRNLNMGYKLYLEHYTIHEEETILYATA